jgi:hypothetical protein
VTAKLAGGAFELVSVSIDSQLSSLAAAETSFSSQVHRAATNCSIAFSGSYIAEYGMKHLLSSPTCGAQMEMDDYRQGMYHFACCKTIHGNYYSAGMLPHTG